VVLFGSAYWQGLIDWIRQRQLAEGKIDPADISLLRLTDSTEDACAWILDCYMNPPWEASEAAAHRNNHHTAYP
jgi:predicted Rossmann-fold nucleotide-binding protein